MLLKVGAHRLVLIFLTDLSHWHYFSCFLIRINLFLNRASLRNLRVRVGEYNLYQAELGHTSQDLAAEKFIQHPRFGFPKRLSNDIGLVKIAADIPLSSYAVPACLPSSADKGLYESGKNGTVAGWGYIRELRLGEHSFHGDSLTVGREKRQNWVSVSLLRFFSTSYLKQLFADDR